YRERTIGRWATSKGGRRAAGRMRAGRRPRARLATGSKKKTSLGRRSTTRSVRRFAPAASAAPLRGRWHSVCPSLPAGPFVLLRLLKIWRTAFRAGCEPGRERPRARRFAGELSRANNPPELE